MISSIDVVSQKKILLLWDIPPCVSKRLTYLYEFLEIVELPVDVSDDFEGPLQFKDIALLYEELDEFFTELPECAFDDGLLIA